MMEIEQETIYGTHEDSHVVMSEKVQSLAGSIYQEFEKMIGKYDQEVVKDLMPLVVNVLECLDLSYTENQEHEVELELLREDNEQLVTQYEREKQLRKATEQKLLEAEDTNEDERKDLNGKIESLESIVRMLELKAKNASDHVIRLEEKENEQKREYSKLHERYTELFKTHMDYMERTKILMGSAERLEGEARSRLPAMSLGPLNRSSGPVSFGFASLETSMRSVGTPSEYGAPVSPPDSNHSNTSLRNELQESKTPLSPEDLSSIPRETSDKSQLTETITMEDRGTLARGGWTDGISPSTKESTPELEEVEDLSTANVVHTPSTGRTKTKKEQRSANTLYQELSFQDAEALSEMDDGADITGSWVHPGEYASSVNDNFFGMGKEVENLILENNELLATKNALNIVKDDLILKVDELTSEQEILREELKSLHAVKGKLKQRITELEDEVRRTKEEAERAAKAAKSDDEEDVPMAQRKRFTRVEMARVLMERNQYKERFMELQEAVRWTEMIRASRIDPLDKKNKLSIWNFFSNLLSTSKSSGASGDKVTRKSMVYVQYNAPTHQVSPGALGSMRKRTLNERKRPIGDYIDGEVSSEKLAARRASERKEQYRQVRAHVRKDDGRLQAYGWSLPAKPGVSNNAGSNSAQPPSTSMVSSASSNSGRIPVPVPIYCRPLAEKEPEMKVWCAAGVNLSGGRTRDGGSVVGASVFYTTPNTSHEETYSIPSDINKDKDDHESEVEQLEAELKERERIAKESVSYEQKLSSLVWIGTSNNSTSKVTVIDANNPADVLESFIVCQSNLLCIASVPGAHENDYISSDSLNLNDQKSTSPVPHDSSLDKGNKEESHLNEDPSSIQTDESFDIGRITFVSCASGSEAPDKVHPKTEDALDDTLLPLNTPRTRLIKEVSPIVKDGLSEPSTDNEHALSELEKMSSVLPTMWLGSQKGYLYIHSAVAHWSHCIHSLRLTDSILSIVHVQGRVVVALADGKVAVFARRSDGQWNLDAYHLVDIGLPDHHSIRCMAGVHGRVWCGYRNNIHVLDPKTLTIEKSLVAHPRKESQVRQMAWLGDGVWVSIRLDSTLRLYHAHTYEHLQDVDIEPYVSKMLGTGKLGFSFVRITTLLISSGRLWIGTGNGVIISVPLTDSSGSTSNCSTSVATRTTPKTCQGTVAPGGVVRVYSDPGGTRVTPATFIPFCSMAQAQLSFHGHRDAVKFFVAVPGIGSISSNNSTTSSSSQVSAIVSGEEKSRPPSMLVMAGGEGYIDFRAGDGDEDIESEVDHQDPSRDPHQEQIYLIVWQVTSHE